MTYTFVIYSIKLLTYLLTYLLRCASSCVVECRISNREPAGSNLGRGYFAPRSTQPSIPSGSVNEYQLRLGRQRQVWLIPLADETLGVQVKRWYPLTMRAIDLPERLRDANSCGAAIQIDYLYLLPPSGPRETLKHILARCPFRLERWLVLCFVKVESGSARWEPTALITECWLSSIITGKWFTHSFINSLTHSLNQSINQS